MFYEINPKSECNKVFSRVILIIFSKLDPFVIKQLFYIGMERSTLQKDRSNLLQIFSTGPTHKK